MKFLFPLFIFFIIAQPIACRHRPIDLVALEESIKEEVLFEMSIPHRRCGYKLISALSRVCSGSADIVFAPLHSKHGDQPSLHRACCANKCSDLDLLSFCGDRKNSDLFYELEK